MTPSAALSRTIQTSPEVAYRALTTSVGLLDWCADAADLAAREGGHMFLWSDDGYRLIGSVAGLEANQAVEWELIAPFRGQIRFRIKRVEDGVKVSVAFPGTEALEEQLAFWDPALDNLKALLETGLDKRIYERPMLGILIGGVLDAGSQERYGTPEPSGVIISGTVAGMGAAALGLQENDVLIELGGVRLEDYHSFGAALEGRRAGDVIPAVWYRGAERLEGELRLSGRPEPVIPPTPTELAEYVRGIYDRLDGELAEILDGVTEEEAEYRPAEREWSAKEIVAHVIVTERGAQTWISAMLNGHHLEEWDSNENSLVKAVADIYPTVPELTGELHRTEGQTVAMLRRLPAEVVEHKGVYTSIVSMLGEHGLPVHTRMHYETVRRQVQEARDIRK